MPSVETLKVQITADNSAAITGVREVKNTIDGLKESIKVYQDQAFAEKDISKLKNYNFELQQLQAQLKQTANVGKVGFDEMGVAIQKASGNPMTQAFSRLREIAYILPGIGIAGIFNLAFEGIGKAAQAMGLFTSKSKEAEAATKKLNQEIISTREAAEKDVSSLRSLINASQDHTLSLEKRLHAVRELQDKYPGYFKDLSREQILNGNLVTVTDQLTAAIYKRAAARVLETQIAEKATNFFLNQQRIEKLNLDIAEQSIRVAQSNKRAAGPLPLGAAAIDNSDQIRQGAVIDDTKKLNELIVERTQLNTQNIRLISQISHLQGDANKLIEETLNLDKKDLVGKKVKESSYQRILETLKSTIDALTALKDANKISVDLFDADKLKAYDTAISGLEKVYDKLGVAGKKAFDDILLKQKELFSSEFDKKMSNESNKLDNIKEVFEKPEKNNTPKYIDGVPQSEADLAKQQSDIAIKHNEKLDADKLKEYNLELAITNGLTNALAGAFDQVIDSGKSLGEALSSVFSDLAKQIEKALIKALIFKAIGAALGVATGGISTLFLSALGGGKGFSQGGFSTGPQSGHMELLHGNEWVLRPDQLNGALVQAHAAGMTQNDIGDRSSTVNVVGKIMGNDIWLSKERTDFQRQLTT